MKTIKTQRSKEEEWSKYFSEIPSYWWNETAMDGVERERVSLVSKDFIKKIKDRQTPHGIYALNLIADETYVRNEIGWFDMDARERFVNGLFRLLIHRVSCYCCPNYKRQIHKDRLIIPLGFIEHYSRTRDPETLTHPLVAPHIHATLAVHEDWGQLFEECFDRNLGRSHYSVKLNHFSGSAFANWERQVKSVRLARIEERSSTPWYGLEDHQRNMNFFNSNTDRWISYGSKQLDIDLQGGAVIS